MKNVSEENYIPTTEAVEGVYAILSCGVHVRAGSTDAGVTARKVLKTIWGATDD